MAKKKTIDKKDAINPKTGTSEKERQQVHAVMTGADVIKSAIRIAAITNKIAGNDGAGLMTILIMAFGDTIGALANATGLSRQQTMNDLFKLLREYVDDDSNFENKPDLNLN